MMALFSVGVLLIVGGAILIRYAVSPPGAYMGLAALLAGIFFLAIAAVSAFAMSDVERVEAAVGKRPGDYITVPGFNRSLQIVRIESLPRGEYAVIVRWAD
jgi:membrane-bound ClpP family serine protease